MARANIHKYLDKGFEKDTVVYLTNNTQKPISEIKIGDKFFRAKNSIAVAGTGIGIYLTKKFIELLNGKFKIESIENSKTVVTVLLPIALN